MSRRTFDIIWMGLAVMMLVSLWFPFQRFDVPIEHVTIIRIALGVGVIGTSVVRVFLYQEKERVWKSTTAGVLAAIAGGIGVTVGLVFAVVGASWGTRLGEVFPFVGGVQAGAFAVPLVLVMGIVALILGIVALVGSVYSFKRRVWGLALAGSICALLIVWFLGVPAVIFVVMGRSEFG